MNLTPQKSLSEINVTSLVDVTMVLLIIFMITSPLMQMGLQVNLPKASAKAVETRGNLVVTVRKDATISVEDRVIPLAALPAEMERAEKAGKKGVLIRADKAVPYGAVVKILDLARKTGINDVGLITELDEDAK